MAGWIVDIGGAVTVRYENVDAIAVTVPANRLARLLASPDVLAVEKDRLVPLPTPSGEMMEIMDMMEMKPLGLANGQLISPAVLSSQIGEAAAELSELPRGNHRCK